MILMFLMLVGGFGLLSWAIMVDPSKRRDRPEE
jgi:hypothetical protein